MNAINTVAACAESTRATGKKKHQASPVNPIDFERADPAVLANFDPATKRCTMNCGQCSSDPRSRTETVFLCEDCEVVPAVQPQQHKRVPVTPNAALTLLLTGYNINDLGYFKENCRWASRTDQNRNRRNTTLLTLNGETACISEWSERTGISSANISNRLRIGWSVERALTTHHDARAGRKASRSKPTC